MTLAKWKKNALTQLNSVYDYEESNAILKLLIEDVTGYESIQQVLHRDVELKPSQLRRLTNYLDGIINEEPVQYVLGFSWFFDLRLKVRPGVLIPRRETEELVQWILDSTTQNAPKILDIGTGSGCIALSLKQQLKTADLTGWDVSEAALEIASENAQDHALEIDFEHKDVLRNLSAGKKWNVIVSNPPYVLNSEKREMRKNVLVHEPSGALFVDDNDSLVFYKAIGKFAFLNLLPDGLLFFEINENKGKEIINLLTNIGFKNIILKKDMQGKDRMVRAQKL